MLERAHGYWTSRKLDELVYVVLEELIIQETERRILEYPFGQGVRKEQRGRIERREECGVDRHHPPQRSQDFELRACASPGQHRPA